MSKPPTKSEPCLVCGEEGRDFQGTPTSERLVFVERTIWSLHRLRQAIGTDHDALSGEVSEIIRRVEYVAGLVLQLSSNKRGN
jgi:hypothetical protein